MAKATKTTSKTNERKQETRRERFVRLAEPRVQRALSAIRLIGNLSTANYDWHEDDLSHIRSVIADQLNTSLSRFTKSKSTEIKFKIGAKVPEEVF